MGSNKNPSTGDSGVRNAAEAQARADFDRSAGKTNMKERLDATLSAAQLEKKHGLSSGGSHPDSRNPISDKGDGW